MTPRLMRTITIACALLALIFVARGNSLYDLLKLKADGQMREVESVISYSKSYSALSAAQKKFELQYPPETVFSDWESYFGRIDFAAVGLIVDQDTLTLSRPEMANLVATDKTGVGLSKACIASAQGGELVVKANNYRLLIEGIQKLLARQDVSADMVAISGDKAPAEGRISNFCLLVRPPTPKEIAAEKEGKP